SARQQSECAASSRLSPASRSVGWSSRTTLLVFQVPGSRFQVPGSKVSLSNLDLGTWNFGEVSYQQIERGLCRALLIVEAVALPMEMLHLFDAGCRNTNVYGAHRFSGRAAGRPGDAGNG